MKLIKLNLEEVLVENLKNSDFNSSITKSSQKSNLSEFLNFLKKSEEIEMKKMNKNLVIKRKNPSKRTSYKDNKKKKSIFYHKKKTKNEENSKKKKSVDEINNNNFKTLLLSKIKTLIDNNDESQLLKTNCSFQFTPKNKIKSMKIYFFFF